MLEELREQADFSSYPEDEEGPELKNFPRLMRGPFLGLTPVQRFVLAALLFATTLLLSTFCLLVSGKVALPFGV